jgi:hypothetical protein
MEMEQLTAQAHMMHARRHEVEGQLAAARAAAALRQHAAQMAQAAGPGQL